MQSQIDAYQDQFLKDELFSLTLMATVQRAGVYSPRTPEKERKKFQARLRAELDTTAETGPIP